MEHNPYAATDHAGDQVCLDDPTLPHLNDEELEKLSSQSSGIFYTEIYFGIFAFWCFFTTVIDKKAPVFDFVFGMGLAIWFGFATWLSRRRRWPGLVFGLFSSAVLILYGLLWTQTSKFGLVPLLAGAWGCVNYIGSRRIFKQNMPSADELDYAKLSRSLAKKEAKSEPNTD